MKNKNSRRKLERSKEKPLEKIRSRYLSLQALADDLAQFADYKGISPSTIFRWLNIEAGKINEKQLPPRAQRAIKLLSSAPPPARLRVALPRSPQSLPIIVLMMLTGKEKLAVPIPSLNFSETRVQTGIEALDALNKEDGDDVAVCYRYLRSEDNEMKKDYGARCARISSFCCQIVQGYGIEGSKYPPLTSRRQLSTTRFGFPSQSGLRIYLEDNIHFEPFGNYVPRAFDNAAQAVEMLVNETIQYALGSRSFLKMIQDEMKRRYPDRETVPFPDSVLPTASFDLFFNKESKNPAAILTLLECLHRTIPQLESILGQFSESESRGLAEALGFSNLGELVSAIKPLPDSNRGPLYDFSLDSCVNLGAILDLWRKSVPVA